MLCEGAREGAETALAVERNRARFGRKGNQRPRAPLDRGKPAVRLPAGSCQWLVGKDPCALEGIVPARIKEDQTHPAVFAHVLDDVRHVHRFHVEVVGRFDPRAHRDDVIVSANLHRMAGVVEQAHAIRLHRAKEAAHDLFELALVKVGFDEDFEVGGPERLGDFPGVRRRGAQRRQMLVGCISDDQRNTLCSKPWRGPRHPEGHPEGKHRNRQKSGQSNHETPRSNTAATRKIRKFKNALFGYEDAAATLVVTSDINRRVGLLTKNYRGCPAPADAFSAQCGPSSTCCSVVGLSRSEAGALTTNKKASRTDGRGSRARQMAALEGAGKRQDI